MSKRGGMRGSGAQTRFNGWMNILFLTFWMSPIGSLSPTARMLHMSRTAAQKSSMACLDQPVCKVQNAKTFPWASLQHP